MKLTLVLFGLLALASATVLFSEDFSDPSWEDRWVVSSARAGERGNVGLSAGKFFTDEEAERGLKTLEDARFYFLTTEFEEFDNKDKTLVLQYSLKQDQEIDCGGGYIKLHPAGIDQSTYNGDTVYNIMFGPDICGGTKRTHVILNRRDENHLITNDVRTETDVFTHVYTLIINTDNTFKVLIDNEEVRSGAIDEEWAILEPKQIQDPNLSKPADWVDESHIDDPEDVKPEGYDDILPEVADPDAVKPDDWEDDLDGEWEAPTIPNPEYKGPWHPKKIDNPEYKGEWVHPMIDNPAYEYDANLYAFDSIKYLGIEIWQVKSGSIFGNFLITDNVDEASTAASAILERVEGEKTKKGEADAAEAAAAAAAAAEEEDEELDDEDEEKEDL